MDKKTKIAYIAPEIPALSATFVYNEIIKIEECGFDVYPISVHTPGNKAMEAPARELSGHTFYLYEKSFLLFATNMLIMLATHPLRFLKTLTYALKDATYNMNNRRISLGIMYRFIVASTVANKIYTNNIKHIHAHFAHIPTDIAMYSSLLTGIPFSFTAHANDIFENSWLLKNKVKRASFVIAISQFNKDYLINLGALADKIRVIHCGVDPDAFQARNKKALGKPLRLGSFGRMVEKKGFDVLIDACKLLKDTEEKPFIMEIAGDGPLKEELRMRVYTLGLSNEIIFTGPIQHDKVSDWLKGLDVFVLTCKKDGSGDMDGIPVVLMEAMLSGVPVISTEISGIPELVEDCVTGSLIKPEDPAGLVSALKRLTQDNDLGYKMCNNAIDKIKKDFDLSINSGRLAALFKESTR